SEGHRHCLQGVDAACSARLVQLATTCRVSGRGGVGCGHRQDRMPTVGNAPVQQLGFERVQCGRHVLEALAPLGQGKVEADLLKLVTHEVNPPAVVSDA